MENLDALLTKYNVIETARLALIEAHRLERADIEAKKRETLAEIGLATRKFNDGDVVADRRGRQYFIVGLRTEIWRDGSVQHIYTGRKVLKSGAPGVRNETLYNTDGLTLVKKAGE